MILNEEQKKLVSENEKLIYLCLHKMKLPISDFYGIAAIGLCNAAYNFNKDLDFTFCTFAMTCINQSLLDFLRQEKNLRHKVLNESVSYDNSIFTSNVNDDNNTFDYYVLEDTEKNIETDYITKDIIKQLLLGESEDIKQIILLRIQGYSNVEIAEMIKTSKQKISKLLKDLYKRKSYLLLGGDFE